MGIRVREGRTFDASDRAVDVMASPDSTSERSVVVNQALAQKYFPGVSPIGRRIGGSFNGWERIVGVVNNVAEGSLTDEPSPARYLLYDQIPYVPTRQTLVIRTTRPADATQLVDAARRTVQSVAPSFAVQSATTMDRVFATAVGPARQVMTLLALLAALALVL